VIETVINKSYKFRLYPNDEQVARIEKTIGCCRYVYNHFLNRRKQAYEEDGKNLTDVESSALQTSLYYLDKAYQRFFREKMGYPKFKSKKKSAQSYTTRVGGEGIWVRGNYVKLPRLGKVRIAKSRELEGRILRATVVRNPSGKYFVSISCEVDAEPLPKLENHIGIDLGIKSFATLSTGESIDNPKYLTKYQKQLSRWQRRMSLRKKGSKNRGKAKKKVAQIYEKIANCRADFLHKLSSMLVNENQVIAIEDLNVKDMLQNKNLAKAISDVSWAEFRRQLAYKSKWYGRDLRVAGRYEATSQVCSGCGYKNPEVKNLSIRTWICPECGANHDRDINAAKNILRLAV